MPEVGPIREYVENRRAVHAREIEERRRESIELRWEQLNAIVGMALALGLPLGGQDEKGVEEVRRRWCTLKDRWEGSR